MNPGKDQILAELAPLLPKAAVDWILKARDRFLSKMDEEDRAIILAMGRAQLIHPFAAHYMRIDPLVAGKFHPVRDEQLLGLMLDGEPRLCLTINKATRDRYGRLRTSSQSDRQSDRRDGALLIGDDPTVPVTLFYEVDPKSSDINPAISRIGVGQEGPSGFEWSETLWTSEGGYASGGGESYPFFPQMPPTPLRLRRPADTGTDTGRKIGKRAEEAQKRAKVKDQSDTSAQGA
ncbi:hypothetical protein BH11PLA1_BH11PLA1_06550 [soil metagenome]